MVSRLLAELSLAQKTVLLLHEDLGFVFWLGHVLDEAGYQAYPAKTVSDAFTLVAELCPAVEFVICDPSLDGIADFLAGLRQLNPTLKVVFVDSSASLAYFMLPERYTTRPKPAHINETTKREWLQVVAELEHRYSVRS